LNLLKDVTLDLSARGIITLANPQVAAAPDVPEPSTALLAMLGLLGLIFGTARRRRR